MNSDFIKISGIIAESIEDGPGFRYTVFTQGCLHNCEGCHNPKTHPLEGGTEMSSAEIINEISANPLLDGLTLSGGEPFLQADKLAPLAKAVRELSLNVITYTGYTFEELINAENPDWDSLLSYTDLLIDGPYINEKRTIDLPFVGSSNQRIIDVKKSLEQKKAVIWQIPKFCEF